MQSMIDERANEKFAKMKEEFLQHEEEKKTTKPAAIGSSKGLGTGRGVPGDHKPVSTKPLDRP